MRRTNEASNRRGHAVTYESRSHWKVITQMWGSVWPKVCSRQFLKRMVGSSSTMALLFLQSGSVSSRLIPWLIRCDNSGSSLLFVEYLHYGARAVASSERWHHPCDIGQGTCFHELAGSFPCCFQSQCHNRTVQRSSKLSDYHV